MGRGWDKPEMLKCSLEIFKHQSPDAVYSAVNAPQSVWRPDSTWTSLGAYSNPPDRDSLAGFKGWTPWEERQGREKRGEREGRGRVGGASWGGMKREG